MIRIFVAIPTMGWVADGQVHVLRDIAANYADTIELVYPAHCVQRRFHDFARNGLVDEFLDSDCDLLWFLDSDIIPPRDILDIVALHGHKWEVAGAPYPIFMTHPGQDHQQIIFTVYKGKDSGGLVATKVPYTGTEFVDGLATGCLFLKRTVFKKLVKPYFTFKYDPVDARVTIGEDLDFCMRLHAQGVPFFVDYSKCCKHIKEVDLLEVNNYTLQFAKTAVENYDKSIRDNVTAAVKAAYEKGFRSGVSESLAPSQANGQREDGPSLHASPSQLILPSGFGSHSSR